NTQMAATLEKMEIVNASEAGTIESDENLDLEEEESFFQDIDLLFEHNISHEDIKMLKKVGINTIKGVQMTMRKKLLDLKGFNEVKVDKIKEACCKIALSNGFMTALEVCDQRKQIFKLSTGSSKLDVAAKFHEEAGIFKLLIVDSIMALFRVDFSGRGEIADRQQKLGQMMSRLQKISEEYNIAVFLTNQITSDFSLHSPEPDLPKPVGGNILAHASTTRVALKKGKGTRRIAKIYDSPDLEENEVTYVITNGGIDDPKD
ncbi:hypothetical protein NQ314_007176, partial [Rhamnusium bicolor]